MSDELARISPKHFSTWITDIKGSVTIRFRNSSVKLEDKDDQQLLSDPLKLNADINDGKIVDITARMREAALDTGPVTQIL